MKYSVSSKLNMEILTVKLQKNEQVVQNEVLWINSQQLTGFVPVETEAKGNVYFLNYNVTGFIPLKKYAKNRLLRNDFAILLESIVKAFEPLQSKGMSYGKVLLEDKSIYINPVSKKGQFIYVPIDTYDNGVYIGKFLLDLLDSIRFVKSEDLGFIQELKMILNTAAGVSWESLNQYVQHLKDLEMQKFQQTKNMLPLMNGRPAPQGQAPINRTPMPQHQPNPSAPPVREHVFCVACGFKNSVNARFCVKCGKPIEQKEKELEVPQQKIPNPLVPVPPTAMTTPQWDDEEDGATTVLGNFDDESEEATTVLSAVSLPKVIYPYLVRENTQEKIQTDKDMFIIGKGKVSDYVITGNNAVSRNHISVITRDNHYYIVDNRSTNRTYIDGQQIQPEQEYEVFAGAKIRMANEEFTFYVEEP